MILPQGIEERDLKECRNHNCSRYYVPVWAPGRSHCSVCTVKLKGISWRAKSSGHDVTVDLPDDAKRTPVSKMAIHYTDFKGNFQEYEQYLERLGVKGYMSYSDWLKILAGNPPSGSENAWQCYNDYLLGIGIAPRKQQPGDSAPRPRIIGITEGRWSRSSAAASDTFTCTSPDVKGCPIITKADEAKIDMPNDMYRTWVYLAKRFNTEWLAYLTGQLRDDGVWVITDMYFPKQECTGAHVDVVDLDKGGDPVREGTIGSVHSHVDMGAFFSTEDEKHFNHPVELIVNRKGDVAISVRRKLECGRYTRTSGTITLIGNDEQQALAAALDAKLAQATTTPVGGSGGYVNNPVAGTCTCTCTECKMERHGCVNVICRIAKQCWCQCQSCTDGAHKCTNVSCRVPQPSPTSAPPLALPN